VPHDSLDMEVPIWDTDCVFTSPKTAAVVTAYAQVRLYDIQGQRRPTLDKKIGELKFSKVTVSNDKNYLFAADQEGGITQLDIRTSLRVVHKLKGSAGSIRDFQVHESSKFIACCGLDRYLRVYNYESKELVSNIYMKQILNALLLSGEEIEKKEEEEKDDDEDQSEKDEEEDDEDDFEEEEEDEEESSEEEAPKTTGQKRSEKLDRKQNKKVLN